MGSFFTILLLALIAWGLFLIHQTLEGFNDDLKQIRMLLGQIERRGRKQPDEE